MFLFLAAYADGSLRANAHRARLRLPKFAWFTELLRKARAGCRFKFDGHLSLLVKVSPGHEYQGPLTPWSIECDLLREFCGGGSDAYSLHIDAVYHVVEPPVPANIQRNRWRPTVRSYTSHCLDVGQLQFIKATDDIRDNSWGQTPVTSLSATEVKNTEGVSDAAWAYVCHERPMLWIPEPIMLLVARLQWSSILLKANISQRADVRLDLIGTQLLPRFSLDAFSWPTEAWIQRVARGPPTSSSFLLPLESRHVLSLISVLRELAPDSLARLEPELAPDKRVELEDLVARLLTESSRETCRQPAPSRQPAFSHCERRDSAADHRNRVSSLLKAFVIATRLRSRASLGIVMRESLALAGFESKHISDIMHNRDPLSSPSLSRYQIFVDICLCRCWGEQHAEDSGPMYLWGDSSPQFGTNWMMSLVGSIRSGDLTDCVQAAHLLQSSVDAYDLDGEFDPIPDKIIDLTERRHKAGLLLKEKFVIHSQVPMGLGSGQASVEHILRTLAQKCIMETSSMTATNSIFSRTRATCVDMGTEVMLNDVENVRARDVLPPWMQEVLIVDMEEDVAHGSDYMFPSSLLSLGTVHVVNNAAKDMDTAMGWWSDFMPGLKALVHLMHHEHLRKRYVGRLLQGTPFSYGERLFARSCPLPAHWRWGSVGASVERVMTMFSIMMATWDPSKFARKGNDKDLDKEDTEQLQVHTLLTRTIRSCRWWSYCVMVSHLHRMVGEISSWLEGCRCHDWLQRLVTEKGGRAFSRAAKRLINACHFHGYRYGDGDGPNWKCILGGKRAPELAVGALQKLLQRLKLELLANIVRDAVPGTTAEDMSMIVHDFTQAVLHLIDTVNAKLQHWQVLPWSLCGLGHWCADTAREHGRRILKQFDDAGLDESKHHRITWEWLWPGSTIRDELHQFLDGAALSILPILSVKVGELVFVPTAERVQEKEHAVAKHWLALTTRRSGVYFSLAVRMPELYARVSCPQDFERMVRLFSFDPRDLCKRLALQNHPLWLREEALTKSSRKLATILSAIVYSTDADTQFSDMQKVRAARALRKKEREKLKPKGPKLPATLDNIRRGAMSDHMQSVLKPGHLYSLPGRLMRCIAGDSFVVSPGASARSRALPAAGDLAMDADDDLFAGDVDLSSDQSVADKVFFRVVVSKPSQRKMVSLPAAADRQLHRSDMCVTLHTAVATSDGIVVSLQPCLSTRSSIPTCLLPTFLQDAADLQTNLFCWSRDKTNRVVLRGREHYNEQRALQELTLARAFPGSKQVLTVGRSDPMLSELQSLQGDGFVQRNGDTGEHAFVKHNLCNVF